MDGMGNIIPLAVFWPTTGVVVAAVGHTAGTARLSRTSPTLPASMVAATTDESGSQGTVAFFRWKQVKGQSLFLGCWLILPGKIRMTCYIHIYIYIIHY